MLCERVISPQEHNFHKQNGERNFKNGHNSVTGSLQLLYHNIRYPGGRIIQAGFFQLSGKSGILPDQVTNHYPGHP